MTKLLTNKHFRRETRLVRIGRENHRKLKILAAEKAVTISSLLDVLVDLKLLGTDEDDKSELAAEHKALRDFLNKKKRKPYGSSDFIYLRMHEHQAPRVKKILEKLDYTLTLPKGNINRFVAVRSRIWLLKSKKIFLK